MCPILVGGTFEFVQGLYNEEVFIFHGKPLDILHILENVVTLVRYHLNIFLIWLCHLS